MKEYRMPIDISEKEKIIGGIFTVMQGICLAIGVAVAIVVAIIFRSIGWPSLLIGLGIGAAIGCVLAFVRVHTYPIWTFVLLSIKRKKTPLENIDPVKTYADTNLENIGRNQK